MRGTTIANYQAAAATFAEHARWDMEHGRLKPAVWSQRESERLYRTARAALASSDPCVVHGPRSWCHRCSADLRRDLNAHGARP